MSSAMSDAESSTQTWRQRANLQDGACLTAHQVAWLLYSVKKVGAKDLELLEAPSRNILLAVDRSMSWLEASPVKKTEKEAT